MTLLLTPALLRLLRSLSGKFAGTGCLAHNSVPEILLLQAQRQFEAEFLPVPELKKVWNALSSTERQELVTFDRDELHKQAVKLTRIDIDEFRGVHLMLCQQFKL